MSKALVDTRPSGIYDVFAAPLSVHQESEESTWYQVDPSQGSDLTNHNSAGTKYEFDIPVGMVESLSDAFFEVRYKTQTAAGGDLSDYVSATANTHVALRNGLHNLFSSETLYINGEPIEQYVNRTACLLDTLEWLKSPKDYVDLTAPLHAWQLDTGTAIGVRTNANTGYAARAALDTADDNDQRMLMKPRFGVFSGRGARALYLTAPMRIELVRSADADMLDRDGTANAGKVVIVSIKLFVRRSRPAPEVMAEILSGIKSNIPQKLPFKGYELRTVSITAGATSHSLSASFARRPSKVIVFQRNVTQSGNDQAFDPNAIQKVEVSINGEIFPKRQLTVTDWGATDGDYTRAYQNYLEFCGNETCISRAQFAQIYTVLVIDCGKSMSGIWEFNNEPSNVLVNVDWAAGGATANRQLCALFEFDRLYTLTGPSGTVERVF